MKKIALLSLILLGPVSLNAMASHNREYDVDSLPKNQEIKKEEVQEK